MGYLAAVGSGPGPILGRFSRFAADSAAGGTLPLPASAALAAGSAGRGAELGLVTSIGFTSSAAFAASPGRGAPGFTVSGALEIAGAAAGAGDLARALTTRLREALGR